MKLSLLSILLGVGMSVPQVYALTKPAKFTAAARRLPRNLPVGVALMLLGTAWFLWIVNAEPIADFSAYKPVMMIAFAAVGILACFFVQDFLAVRGLAVVLLLLGKLMVDTGRPHLGESDWVLVIQAWAYVFDRHGHLAHHHAVEIARPDPELGDGDGKSHPRLQPACGWRSQFSSSRSA